jgi:ATP-dependent RNA helicase RhlE
MSSPSFAELGVSEPVIEVLAERGITRPFPIQSVVVPDAMAGRDVLARSRTGSGKTFAFVLPIVERLRPDRAKPRALVLVPTRELAAQVVEEFASPAEARGLGVAAAYGGVGIRDQRSAVARADILVATPGRLEDLAARGMVRLDSVAILVLDEADRMLDMGFQPQVDRIVRRLPKDRQTMFFSATLDGTVGRLAEAYTRHPVRHELGEPRATVDEASHRFVSVSAADKVDALVRLLEDEDGLVLVFVRTKRGADRLAARLRSRGLRAEGMHGDLSQAQRERALRWFEQGSVRVLVATDVAARGLDVDGIARVINYDPPAEDKDYVHRVGRTARAGRTGTGVTLVTAEQQGDVGRMAARLALAEDFERSGLKVAPPRVVFASARGRRSMLYRPPRRRA